MAGKIIRVTMFKLPEENLSKMSELYKTLSASAKKVRLTSSPSLSLRNPPLIHPPQTPAFQAISSISYSIIITPSKQDGKPYILSLEAGPLFDDVRSQGFTYAAKSEFASKEDMAYYDTDCEAHATLKAGAKDFGIHGMMMVYY